MTAPPEIGQAEPPGQTAGIGGTGLEWSKSMVPRTGNIRNSAPLAPIPALFAALEAATLASDRAHERDEQQAPALLAHRDVIVQQIVGTAGTGGAR